MDLQAFKASLEQDTPPRGLEPALEALWLQATGRWDRAHELVQSQHDEEAAWVHAHLHRAKGDNSNARSWYRRVGKPYSEVPLRVEWEAIVTALLAAQE